MADQQAPWVAGVGHHAEAVARPDEAGRLEADLDRLRQHRQVAELACRERRPEAALVGGRRGERAMADPARVVAAAHVVLAVPDLAAAGGDEAREVAELERQGGVRQAERAEQLAFERPREAAGGGRIDDPSHEQEARVRVRPAGARLEVGSAARARGRAAPRRPTGRTGARARAACVLRQPAVVRDPARVVQQLAERGAREARVVDPGRDRRLEVELEPQAEDAEKRLRDAVDEVAAARRPPRGSRPRRRSWPP